MDFQTFLLVLFSIVSIYTIFTILNSKSAEKSSKLPPGPYPLPIIGNIFDIGPKPNLSLTELSKKYGPLMSLKLGSMTSIVVSSPETAKMVFQKHDLAFSSRTVPSSTEALNHHESSIGWLPVGNQWRKLRKLCNEQIFSVAKLDGSEGLRREKVQKLRDYVNESREKGRVVDIGDAAFTTALNLISSSLFSIELAQFDSNASHEMKDVMTGITKYMGVPNLADFFPIMKPFDPQRLKRQTGVYFQRMFAMFDGIIEERLKSRGENPKDDMIETLIDITRQDEAELSIEDMKHLFLDLFIAGAPSAGGAVEWAMTELLRNPNKMSRLRKEIRDVVGENKEMKESDITRLPYLQAVVNETLRLHPPGPFLVPHRADSDVEINGYIVPKNAQILVNVWAIGRDPRIWPEADSFSPERFLNREVDLRGKDFEYFPFGSGRRICPGLNLGHRMLHLILATLVGDFGWELENKMKPEDLDVNEKFGLSMQREESLKAVPII